jgi:hypothetical protein
MEGDKVEKSPSGYLSLPMFLLEGKTLELRFPAPGRISFIARSKAYGLSIAVKFTPSYVAPTAVLIFGPAAKY